MVEGRTEYCATHGHQLRREERNAAKVKTVKPIKKVSTKRAGQIVEYRKLREDYLALYPVCEEPGCESPSVEIHHQKGKENDLLLDTNYFLATCVDHHRYYTDNSKEAIEKGYSVLRTTKNNETV